MIAYHLGPITGNVADRHAMLGGCAHVDFVIACSRAAHDAQRRSQRLEHLARENAIRRDDGIGAARMLDDELGRTSFAHRQLMPFPFAQSTLRFDIGEIEPDDSYPGHIAPS